MIGGQTRGEAPPTHRKQASFWKELPFLLVIAVVVALLVRGFVLQTFWIPSASMEQTLLINDHVLVNKLIYDFRSPARGDVIVFTAPASWRQDPTEEDFIKRVIGVGGDHVVCCDAEQRITVNGSALDEPYVPAGPGTDSPRVSPDRFDVVVPAGRLWVMGDNRHNSADSRYNWVKSGHDMTAATIPESAAVGRAFVLFWPFNRMVWLSTPDTYDHVPAGRG